MLKKETTVPEKLKKEKKLPEKLKKETKIPKKFTDKLVLEHLQLWCDTCVNVGKCYVSGGDYVGMAVQVLEDCYDYNDDPLEKVGVLAKPRVLFKPTLAYGNETYRWTKEAALAYFVGGDKNFPNDNGFMLKPWTKVWFAKPSAILLGDVALVQTSVHFVGDDESHVLVNKSFVLKLRNGKVKFLLHQSSLPYDPKKN